METITEALTTAVTFQSHLNGLERAQRLLDLIQRAKSKAERKRHEAKYLCEFSVTLVNKRMHQAEIAEMAAKRLNRIYKKQLFNLFYKSKF
jgi:hypothetical protein